MEPLLLPPEPPKPKGGRPRVPDRASLAGIVFVLKSGISWEMLPQEMGCGSGSTCWRRLRDWEQDGVWEKLHRVLLYRLREADEIDWERASLDSASVPAKRGGEKTGKNPTDIGKPGSKRHIFRTEKASRSRQCSLPPTSTTLTSSRNWWTPSSRSSVPRVSPHKRPAKLHADKGYDAKKCRQALRGQGIKSRIARKGEESSERLGRQRWVVERTLAWLACYRRLVVRYERRADLHEALLHLGCYLICLNYLT